jgi:NADH-quinone oxidoreductase subunit H
MFTKEDIVPEGADKVLHTMAPFFSVFFALVTFAAIPFGDRLIIGDLVIELQVAKIDAGLLYVFAMLSLGVYGVILAGFASRNNYAMLGGLRAMAQMISYEIALGVAVIGVIMVYGTMDLAELVRAQGRTIGGWIPFWGVVAQPVAFVVFVTAALAETKRLPFDLPEGESEIIGYFVEYSGMKFGMFFLTDFLETIVVASLATTLFFGGWQVPYLMPDGFHFPWGGELLVPNLIYVLLGVASFSIKCLVFCFLFMQLRWTLPRFRYDQLMKLGWKGLFPIAVINVVVTAVVLLFFGEAP